MLRSCVIFDREKYEILQEKFGIKSLSGKQLFLAGNRFSWVVAEGVIYSQNTLAKRDRIQSRELA